MSERKTSGPRPRRRPRPVKVKTPARAAKPNQADPAGLAAREAAFDLLSAVLRDKRPLDDALAAHAGLAALEPRDRGFARALVATTLRRLGQIDDLIDHVLEKPLPERAAVVRDLLRLGTAQLVFLETAPHAVVDLAVTQTSRRGHDRMCPLVNAVLRRIAREGAARAAGHDAPRLNTPDWLWQSWSDAYGEAACRAIATLHLEEPPLDITVAGDPAAWRERLEAQLLATGSLRRTAGGAVAELPGYRDGAWWVQDAAASLPARLFGEVTGHTIVDLCAAPGGKSAQLAAAGAKVIALDRSAGRIETLRGNLERLHFDIETIVADGALWRPKVPVDGVLLDAPCSATGAIRRHPDVPHLKTASDVTRMIAVQDRLLAAAAEITAPGGILIYCTCSLQPEEGPERIAALLAGGAPFERMAIDAGEIGGLADAITPQGELRTLPCHLAEAGGMDGFYAARLRRLP